MVEGNENQSNRPDSKGAPKRRGGLFGGRRGRGRGAQQTPPEQPGAVDVTPAEPAAEPLTEHTAPERGDESRGEQTAADATAEAPSTAVASSEAGATEG
ncbi:hypothetical protein, partial [Agromyces terreus]